MASGCEPLLWQIFGACEPLQQILLDWFWLSSK